MTQLSKNALIAKFNDSLNGLYKAGQTLGIGSSSHRTLVQDLMDSLVGFDDVQSGSIPIIQLFYPTVGMGTTTAEYDWQSSYQNIGLLVADYDDITIDFQNRVIGSKGTLFVIKEISGDVTLTIPSMQAVGDSAATTSIVLSGATDTIFRIDFFTTANGGFVQIAEPDATYKKIIHVSESVVWAVDVNKIYKSTDNGVTFSLIYTVTPNTVGYTTSIVDFDISGVYIWVVSQEIDVNGQAQANKIIGSDDTGATFALTATSPLGSSQLVTSVAIFSGTEVFFGADSTGTTILYANTSVGGNMLFGNIVSGTTENRAAIEFALSTDLFVLHSSSSTFANQISKRTSAGTFTKTATAPPDTCKLLSIDFATSTLGIVVGYDSSSEPIIYKTTDAGATWTAETINANIGILRRVRAVTATSFICIGDSGIGYSTDSGDTWQYFETPTSGVSLSAWDANDILIGTSSPYLCKGFGSAVPDVYELHEQPSAGSGILKASVNIAGGATLRGIGSTPATIIAAPGADLYIHIISIAVSYNYGTAVYNFGANGIFRFTGAGTIGYLIDSSWLNSSADYNAITTTQANSGTGGGFQSAPTNTAFTLGTIGNVDATTGDGDLDIVVYYTIESKNT